MAHITTPKPKRNLTDERLAEMQAARARQVEKYRKWRESGTVIFGHWRIFQLNEHNWVLTDRPADEATYRYYPSLTDALRALLYRSVEEIIRTEIRDILAAVEQAMIEIIAAVREAGFFTVSLAENGDTAHDAFGEGNRD